MNKPPMRDVQTVHLTLLLCVLAIPLSAVPLSGLVFVCMWLLFTTRRSSSNTMIDLGVTLLTLSYALSGFTAGYKPAASVAVGWWLVGLAIYRAIRRDPQVRLWLLPTVTLLFAFYTLLALENFINSYRVWHALGFTRLADFRAYVRPVTSAGHVADYNVLALIGLTLCGLCVVDHPKPYASWRVALSYGSAVTCLLCLLLSFSRAMYLALALATLLTVALSRCSLRKPARYCAIGTSLIVALIALSLPDIGRAIMDTASMWTLASQRRSVDGRALMERTTLTLIAAHPIHGVGPGGLIHALVPLSGVRRNVSFAKAHNTLLATTAENGCLGAVSLLLVSVGVVRRLTVIRRSRPASLFGVWLFSVTALVVYLQFENVLMAGRVTVASLLALLALMEVRNDTIKSVNVRAPLSSSLITWSVAALMITYVPRIIDVEIRNTQLRTMPPKREDNGSNQPMLRTLFNTNDPYIDYVNVDLIRVDIGPPRSWSDLFSGRISADKLPTSLMQTALAAWQTLVAKMPEEDGSWENLARLAAMSGDRGTALDAAQRAVSLRPWNVSHYLTLALLQESYGLQEQAVSSYAEAISLQPQVLLSPLWRDLVSRDKEEAARALSAAKLLDLDQYRASHDELVAARLARLLWIEGDKNQALHLNDATLQSFPILAGAWELRGEMLIHDHLRSDECYRRASFLQPADPLPLEELAMSALDQGMLDEAASLAVEALQRYRLRSTEHSLEQRAGLQLPVSVNNDSVPTPWLYYIGPAFDFYATFNRLADAFERKGNLRNAVAFRKRAQELHRVHE